MPHFCSPNRSRSLSRLQLLLLATFVVVPLAWNADAEPPPTTSTTLPGDCGDGVVEGNEDCDNGEVAAVNGKACANGCRVRGCGKPTGAFDAKPLASDALFVLRSAVGISTCDACVCDVDHSGKIVAGDALRVLRKAVGQDIALDCLACADLKRQGAFLVQEAFPIPAEAREGVLLEAEHIAVQGVDLAEDGSVVTWPPRGAGGWWVRFGATFAVTDSDGGFRIELPQGGPTTGTISHPQEPDTALFAIDLADLAPLDVDPKPLSFQRVFYGPCGMNADKDFPDPAVCSEIAPPVSALIGPGGAEPAESPHHHHDALPSVTGGVDDGIAFGQFGNAEPAQTSAARGTYPAGGQKCCKDYDGGSYDGGTLSGVILNYYGSTCQKFISSGCCGGELGSLTASAKAALGLLTPKACEKNHRGRYCQELKEGDISVDIGGQIAHANVSISSPHLNLGESVSLVVHNNGCFGDTSVERKQAEIFGVLTGAGFDGTKVNHASTGTYTPDVTMTFATPRCVGSLFHYAHDHYMFGADGKFASIWFTMSPNGLYRFLPDGPVFSNNASNKYQFSLASADLCDGLHVHGKHPCTGAAEPPGAGPCGHGKVAPYVPPFRS